MNVFKQFLDFRLNLQIGIFDGVVSSWNIFIIISILIIIFLSTYYLILCTLLLLLLLRLLSLTICLVTSPYIIHIDLIVFFFRLNFLTIININCKIIWLIFKFFSFDLFFLILSSRFGPCRYSNFFCLTSIFIIFYFINIFTVIECIIII